MALPCFATMAFCSDHENSDLSIPHRDDEALNYHDVETVVNKVEEKRDGDSGKLLIVILIVNLQGLYGNCFDCLHN